eukprot:CAMPEP_0176015864 /NCGR_PEP_ID=MMETSP0120_2-20121206/7556_1 /TAXON_ID=160619 /ORGANISM="Kryptoperidinium foliaceum, Strain CCMP 1326" /LENGTH=845 /DNA_ID=CAMNT_0017348845 /DNA_START=20 /DNA_END=2558 /DNA_ORIENTATION=+
MAELHLPRGVPEEAGQSVSGASGGLDGDPFVKAPSLQDYLLLFPICALPSAGVVFGLSLAGIGLQLYNLVARLRLDLVGNVLAVISALYLCCLYIIGVDVRSPQKSATRFMYGAVMFFFGMATTICKGITYPWATMLCTLGLEVVLLIEVRNNAYSPCKRMSRIAFMRSASWCALVAALFVAGFFVAWMFMSNYTPKGAQWWNEETRAQLRADSASIYSMVYHDRALVYEADCGPSAQRSESDALAAKIARACSKADTVLFAVWMAPLMPVFFNVIIAGTCWGVTRALPAGQGEAAPKMVLRGGLVGLVVLCTSLFAILYVGGASAHMASALMTVFAVGVVGVFTYARSALGTARLKQMTKDSLCGRYLIKASESDWGRAVGVVGVNFFIPLFLFLDLLRQACRKRAGGMRAKCSQRVGNPSGTVGLPASAKGSEKDAAEKYSYFTELALVQYTDEGELLCELGLVLTVGSKLTFILFSWLNVVLASVDFLIVIVAVLGTGIFMFLLPPVPGSAVYLFYGVVIGSQAERIIGFGWAVVLASGLGLVAKLVACAGQYLIGVVAGQSLAVQKTIGVDTAGTKAIAKILRRPGLDIGKVAILIGGPDWPTSVTCGILELNLPQMLLGTLPVLITSIVPQVLVGALVVKDTGEDADVWYLNQTAITGAATIAQIAASGIAAHKITTTVDTDPELQKDDPAHAKIKELRLKEEAATKAFERISAWENWGFVHKAVLIIAACLQLLGVFAVGADYILFEPICFRKFAITDRFDASLADGGLDGSLLNIVYVPQGAVVLAAMCFASCLHLAHGFSMSMIVKKELGKVTPGQDDQQSNEVKPIDGEENPENSR